MSNGDFFVHHIVNVLPFLVCQAAMAYLYLRWANPRRVRRVIALAVIGLVGTFIFVTEMMDTFPWFWPAVRPLAPHFSWMRTTARLWMYPSSLSFLISLLYRFVLSLNPPGVNPGRRRLIHTAGAAAMAAPFAAEAFGTFIGRLDFHAREVDLRVRNLHPDLEGIRILQLSDVHLSAYLSVKEFARMIDASNGFRPHVALMTGDLISTWGDPIDDCLTQLTRVRADSEMLGCLGNHELYTGTEQYATLKGESMGVHFLRYRSRELRFGKAALNFGGIDYVPFKMRGRYLRGAENLKSAGALNILLSHNPDVFPEAAAQGWDVTLAGHTHGGQVTVEILEQTLNPARVYTRYVSGLYKKGDAQCYVTRGIGTIGIPTRLGATPEITLLRLRKA